MLKLIFCDVRLDESLSSVAIDRSLLITIRSLLDEILTFILRKFRDISVIVSLLDSVAVSRINTNDYVLNSID